jgi:hypothetical protein
MPLLYRHLSEDATTSITTGTRSIIMMIRILWGGLLELKTAEMSNDVMPIIVMNSS